MESAYPVMLVVLSVMQVFVWSVDQEWYWMLLILYAFALLLLYYLITYVNNANLIFLGKISKGVLFVKQVQHAWIVQKDMYWLMEIVKHVIDIFLDAYIVKIKMFVLNVILLLDIY